MWVYLLLLLIEGALRKWFLHPFQVPLLVVRIPVAFVAIFYGMQADLFKGKAVLSFVMWLGAFTFLAGVLEVPNTLTAIYGWCSDFLPLPIAYLFGMLFGSKELSTLGKWVMGISLPHGLLMALQLFSPSSSVINYTPDNVTEQITLGEGFIRPAGLFSQIVGPAFFYPIVLAFCLSFRPRTKAEVWLRVSGFAGVLIALAFSGSRMAWSACALVVAVLVVYVVLRDSRSLSRLAAMSIVGALLGAALLSSPYVSGAIDVFLTNRVDGSDDFLRRATLGFVEPFETAGTVPLLGYGLGIGTVAGANLSGYVDDGHAAGAGTFGETETDTNRNVIESGPILGLLFSVLRITGFFFILYYTFTKKLARTWLCACLAGVAATSLLNAQLGQQTECGFAIIGLGIWMAATGILRVPSQQRKATSKAPNFTYPALSPIATGTNR